MKRLPTEGAVERLRELEKSLRRQPTAGAKDHLSGDELVAFATDAISFPAERERVDEHLSLCEQCGAEIEGLLAVGEAWDGAMAAVADEELSDVDLWAYLCRELETRRQAAIDARRATDAELEARLAALLPYTIVPVGGPGLALQRLGGAIARTGLAPTLHGAELGARIFEADGERRTLVGRRQDVVRCALIRAGLSEDGALEVRLGLPNPVRLPSAPGKPLRVTGVELDLRDQFDKTFYRVATTTLMATRYLGRPVLLAELLIPGAAAPGPARVVDPAVLTLRLLVDRVS